MLTDLDPIYLCTCGVWCVSGFLSAAAWFEPFAAPTANAFKLGSEIALLLTLMLAVLLKIDLTKEDIPDAEDTIGLALLYANTVPTAASLVLAILSHGLDARDAIKAWKGDEDECGKKSKQEVGRTELALACLLAVRIILSSFFTEFDLGRLTNCVLA